MEEKMNILYGKEAEFVNLSAKAEGIHKERLAKEKILEGYKAREGAEIAD